MKIGLFVTGAETEGVRLFQISVSRTLLRVEPPFDPDGVDFVFHLPSHFSINRFLPLPQMTEVLVNHPHLVQVALRTTRLPVDGRLSCDWQRPYYQWVEQRRVFFDAPALFPVRHLQDGWPETPETVLELQGTLLADPQAACAIWGRRAEICWVTSNRPVVELHSPLL